MEEIFEAKEFAKAIKEKKDEVFFIGQDKYTALVSRKKKVPFLGKISSRTQIYTSAKDEKFLEKVLEKMKQDGVTYSRIGNTMFGLKNKPNFVLDGLNFIERFTFVLDLKKSKDELWNKLDKKSRNAVRKAEKEGIIVKKIEDEEELNEYYRLALLNEKRISKKRSSFMLNPKSFFEYVFKEMVSKKMATFFIAKDENRIIAGALFFHTGKKIIYYHGCSLREYSNKQAPSKIQWESILYAKKEKYEIYDFGGCTPNLTDKDSRFFVYEYKRKWGGKLVSFYNIEYIPNKLYYFIQNNLLIKPFLFLRKIRNI